MRRSLPLLTVFLCLSLAACQSGVHWVGIQLFYDRAQIEKGEVLRDVRYWQGEGAEPEKHRLDFFVPAGRDWPILIFVHGGGWTEGDKDYRTGGADVYGNVGRFYASQGVGTAVISYRLQFEHDWRDQVRDVARAVAWAAEHAAERGGDAERLFLAGHSAGAQLATYTALAPWPLEELGLSPEVLCGVVSVSGAGYDLQDEKTYELGAERAFYEKRFRAGDPTDAWWREASATTYLTAGAPPFLLLYSRREWPSLRHQNVLLEGALEDVGVPVRRLELPGQSHARMVLALSREDNPVSREVLTFVRDTRCAG